MLQSYPKFKRLEVEEIYKKLPKSEQKLITDYLFYRQSCGLQRTSDLRRAIIQIRQIIDCNFKDFNDLNQHTRLVVLIKQSHYPARLNKTIKLI